MSRAKWDKSLREEATLREIFKDRSEPLLGLTKFETISLFYRMPLGKVLNLSKDKISQMWTKVMTLKKNLRKEKIIPIIQVALPRGTILNDAVDGLGFRELKSRTIVYYKCNDLDSANTYRSKLNKVAESIYIAGNEIYVLAEEQSNRNKIIEVVNQTN